MDEKALLEDYHANLLWELERIVDCARAAGDRLVGRAPAAPGANSLAGIATHALGAAREHVLGWILRGEVGSADDAFDDTATVAAIDARFEAVRTELEGAFGEIAGLGLDHPAMTAGRGAQPTWSVLTWAILHAAEHAGAAELTRDLLGATGEGAG